MNSRVFFILNSLGDPKPTMTTTRLFRASLALGFETILAPFETLELLESGQLAFQGVRPLEARDSPEALINELPSLKPQRFIIEPSDQVFLRTNPARITNQRAHRFALELISVAEARGLRVTNSAKGLIAASSKLYLEAVPPKYRLPHRLVQTTRSALEAFEVFGPELIIKPIEGSRGVGVLTLHREMEGLSAILELALSQGPALVQPRLRGAIDLRLVVLDGEPLIYDGEYVAIARLPAEGEHRANLHQGGSAARATINERHLEAVRAMAPRLREDGLRLVGLDFLGEQILELNVFAPGGLRPFEELHAAELGHFLFKKLI